MIELIFTACLIATPAGCEERHLTFSAENLTPMACLMGSQPQLAEWAGMHPHWRVTRYKCAEVRSTALNI